MNRMKIESEKQRKLEQYNFYSFRHMNLMEGTREIRKWFIKININKQQSENCQCKVKH